MWTHNQHNGFYIRTKPIDKMHHEIHGIGVVGVGRQLINQLDELLDIVRNRGCLTDVEQLANEELLLITIKAIVHQATEIEPGGVLELGFDGLEPDCCWAIEMHFSDRDPQGFMYPIHGEVLLSAGTPQTWIFAIETREVEHGKAPGAWWVELWQGRLGRDELLVGIGGGGNELLVGIGGIRWSWQLC